jgi:ribosomal protein S18 acetylase RimI-like enzyme
MASIAVARRGTLTVRTMVERGTVRAFLERDRRFAAYAICDLDEREAGRSVGAVAFDGDEPVAAALEYTGLSPQPVFLMGTMPGISLLLKASIRPRTAYVACLPEAIRTVSEHYRLEPGPRMLRMWTNREHFHPYPDIGVERLGPSDAPELNRLYRLGFGSWLSSRAVLEGVYYGLRINGRLVSAAGTHIVSNEARLAVVGNVLTDSQHRGRGYATAVTGAVTAELLRTCDDVVLNVRADNPPALNAYRRLGYAEHVAFEERLARRIASPWSDLLDDLRRRFTPWKESRPS